MSCTHSGGFSSERCGAVRSCRIAFSSIHIYVLRARLERDIFIIRNYSLVLCYLPQASSMLSIMATQQMLYALGVGGTLKTNHFVTNICVASEWVLLRWLSGRAAVPTAAAVNWVLKDGLGRLGKFIVSTKFGNSFDSNLKRFRYNSSIIYSVSRGMRSSSSFKTDASSWRTIV